MPGYAPVTKNWKTLTTKKHKAYYKLMLQVYFTLQGILLITVTQDIGWQSSQLPL